MFSARLGLEYFQRLAEHLFAARLLLSPKDVSVLLLLGFVGFAAARPRERSRFEPLLHAAVRALVHVMYRMRKRGLHHLPAHGPALIVCNHVSFIDAFIIAGASRRPIRFVMHHRIYGMPILRTLFEVGGVIPIAPRHEDAALLDRAFDRIDADLAAGELVCIFPEGKVTRTGDMNAFRTGVEAILARRPVPVVPMALRGLWGSFFSRRFGEAMSSWPRRFWSKIELVCGPALSPTRATAAALEHRVRTLLHARRNA